MLGDGRAIIVLTLSRKDKAVPIHDSVYEESNLDYENKLKFLSGNRHQVRLRPKDHGKQTALHDTLTKTSTKCPFDNPSHRREWMDGYAEEITDYARVRTDFLRATMR